MIITPYNELDFDTNAPTTGGTWTLLTAGGPAAPGAWNGTIDFTSALAGIYQYEYEVVDGTCGAHSVVLTVNRAIKKPQAHDECLSARFFIFGTQSTGHDTTSTCPGFVAATASAEALPAAWGAITLDADLWFEFAAPASATDYVVAVTVDGGAYGSGGITPYGAIYSGPCGVLVEEDAKGPFGQQVVLDFIVTAAAAPTGYYLRVGNIATEGGKFNIIAQ